MANVVATRIGHHAVTAYPWQITGRWQAHHKLVNGRDVYVLGDDLPHVMQKMYNSLASIYQPELFKPTPRKHSTLSMFVRS